MSRLSPVLIPRAIGATMRKCKCGSGKTPSWRYDARGIPLDKRCSECWPEARKKYRREILDGYDQDDVDEPIEPTH